MNKKYEPGKEERHENRRLEQQSAEEKHARQAGAEAEAQPTREGGFRKGEQQSAEEPKHRQQGGWSPDEDRSGRKPAGDRDRDYDPDGDRVSSND